MGCTVSHIGVIEHPDPSTAPPSSFLIKCDKALRVPALDVGSDSDPYVCIRCGTTTYGRTSVKYNEPNPIWNEVIDVTGVTLDDEITFELWDKDQLKMSDRIGFARVLVRDLIKRPTMVLLLNRPSGGDFVIKRDANLPTELHVSVVKVPLGWPTPTLSPHFPDVDKNKYPKHVMIITRGTRGDVQPYMALARGLANTHGYCVSVVTELRYKDFVAKNALGLERGCIRFRPSGGDTHSRIDRPIAKWAMAHPSEIMQVAMCSRTEREFFSSEAPMYFWTSVLQPDAIVYGFTLASIATILSEKFHIPCVGFILQPTVIPSVQYPPVASIDTHYVAALDKLERRIATHDVNLKLKRLWEDDPLWKPLSRMRQRRGLHPFHGQKSETYSTLLEQGATIVVPINEVAFGGRPPDWAECINMTDFIFLQGKTVPTLSKQITDFIAAGKQRGDPVVAMTFSSMPVSRGDIVTSSLRMVKECTSHPSIIALSGPKCKDSIPAALGSALKEQLDKGKILELDGAPFGLLFNELDGVIVHGGLGTTADAMRAGIPTTVVGVLLLDQRFWGMRCDELGIGPPMTHIASWKKRCVHVVDDLLLTKKYKDNAKALAGKIKPQSADGVPENVAAVVRAIEMGKPIDTSFLRISKKDSVSSVKSDVSSSSSPKPSPRTREDSTSTNASSQQQQQSRQPRRRDSSVVYELEPDIVFSETDDAVGVAWLETREVLD